MSFSFTDKSLGHTIITDTAEEFEYAITVYQKFYEIRVGVGEAHERFVEALAQPLPNSGGLQGPVETPAMRIDFLEKEMFKLREENSQLKEECRHLAKQRDAIGERLNNFEKNVKLRRDEIVQIPSNGVGTVMHIVHSLNHMFDGRMYDKDYQILRAALGPFS